MRIFLVGFMGSGKSMLGEKIAAMLKIPFVDLDKKIEKQQGKTVAEIFQKKGENYFRTVEAEVLRKTKRYTDSVIATGGGAPCFHDNMKWMNENGITVYLSAKSAELYHRLLSDRENRPLIASLSDITLLEFIMGTLGSRERFYAMAHVKLNAKTITAHQAVDAIKKVGKKPKAKNKR
ncbi:MAG TPA: shikimate kinase [Bacteroidia bacterium]|nr:shikimate kinase [Bacteroidia bacterium]